MKKDLVFIASGGRTGTQFLGDELSRVISDCYSVHEPDILFGLQWRTVEQIRNFGLWHMILGRLLGAAGIRVLGHRLLVGDLSAEVVRRRIARSRRRYHERIREPLIIESNYQFWFLTGEIHKIWPGAKVIGVIRDPRTWVRSWLNRKTRYDELDKVENFPPGRLTPSKLGEADWAARWEEIGVFGRLAWEWRTIYTHLSGQIAVVPNARMFRFEDLFQGDASAISELVHFAAEHGQRKYQVQELTGFTDHIRNASAGAAQDWPSWTGAEARLLDELCGPLMRRYGYGDEPEWQKKLEEDSPRPLPRSQTPEQGRLEPVPLSD